jgi:hypothetical protein
MAKLYSLKNGKLPSKGEPGCAYFCTDTKTVWIADAEGVLLNLNDIMAGATSQVRAVGPVGEKGDRGEPGPAITGATGERGPAGRDGNDSTVPGPRGLRGFAGRDGKDGKDSTVPGPKGDKGDLIVGPRGEKGERGDVSIIADADLQKAFEKHKRRFIDYQARVRALLQAKIDGLGDHPAARMATEHLKAVLKEAEKV